VLATNVDIIFSNELFDVIASGELEPGYLYRVDRHDITSDLPSAAPLEQQMTFCAEHQIRVHTRWGTYSVDAHGQPAQLADDIVDGTLVKLVSGWHVREGGGPAGFYRWAQERASVRVEPARLAGSGPVFLEIVLESNPYDSGSSVHVELVDGQGRPCARRHVRGRSTIEFPLDGDAVPSTYELRVVPESSAQGGLLALFESRGSLCFVVRRITVRRVEQIAAHSDPYAATKQSGSDVERRRPEDRSRPQRLGRLAWLTAWAQQRRQEEQARAEKALGNLDGWRAPIFEGRHQVERTTDGFAVVTDKRQFSYCLEIGPLRAPIRGTYSFVLRYELQSGGVTAGVLSGNREKWQPFSTIDDANGKVHTLRLTGQMTGGQVFWLVLSNNHPDGNVASAFVVKDLHVCVEPVGRPSKLTAVARAAAWKLGRLVRLTSSARRRLWLPSLKQAFFSRLLGFIPPDKRRQLVETSTEFQALQQSHDALVKSIERLAPLEQIADLYNFLRQWRPDNIHQNSCGDFQLMAREHWCELRGYPEFRAYSMNIDGLFGTVASYAGIKERALPAACRIYHLEHEIGSGWTPEGDAVLRKRIAERGITWVSAKDVFVWGAYMRWIGRPMIFNHSDWGFGSHTLTESVIPAARHLRTNVSRLSVDISVGQQA
jgi:hypothetical protein